MLLYTVDSGSDWDEATIVAERRRWVVYQSGEGRPEIYLRPASGADRKWQVSVDGGTFPIWSPEGNEIFFLSGAQV